MGVRSYESAAPALPPRVVEPSLRATFYMGLLIFIALIANGRPIGSGDTRSIDHVAASLVGEGDFDLDEYPEVTEPFAKTVGEHRVSVYPVASAILAAPVFAAAGAFFALDETGCALAGKWAAAALSALAAAVLFRAVARRRGGWEAVVTALSFALGTSVWSTSQALWQHPAVIVFLSIALWFVVRAEEDSVWAARAGLPLALAAGSRHAVAVLVAILAIGIAVRWPRRILGLVAWAAPAVLLVAAYQWFYFGAPWRHGFSDSLSRFSEPVGRGHLALLFSPSKGLFVFTPLALVAIAGLVDAARGRARWFALTLGAAALGHWLTVGFWNEWHGGESFGPRLLTDLLPLLFVFLPEGRDVLRGLFAPLAIVSVAIQALGAFSYDYRWERLFQRQAGSDRSWVWNWRDSPIAFHLKEHVLIAALPAVRDGRAFVRERRFVPFAPEGSRLLFDGDRFVVSGADMTFGNAHLQRGARVIGGKLMLQGHWDGVFFRVRPFARQRTLEVRVAGSGKGTLYVGASRFFGGPAQYKAYPMDGAFLVRHSYRYSDAGGEDVLVTLGRAAGRAAITSVSLVPPSDGLNPIVLDGSVPR